MASPDTETVVIERVFATEQDRQYARAVLEPLNDRQRRAVYAVVLEIAAEMAEEEAGSSGGEGRA